MVKIKNKHSLVFCIILHQPYLGENILSIWNRTLFPAMTDIYIPLLNMFDNLTKDKVPFCLNMVLTPTLCSLLDDPMVQEQYTLWLEHLINFGEKEIKRTKNDLELHDLAKAYVKNLKQIYSYFVYVCDGSLLSKFNEYIKSEHIELMATAVDYCYFPHYKDLSEVLDAQIEAGLIAHRKFFGVIPNGFWLPLMGYTHGLAANIRKYGFDYTILDTHGFLFADPVPKEGIFSPLRCSNSLAVFARDSKSQIEIFGDDGFSLNTVYRDSNRDIGFELHSDDLQEFFGKNRERYATGFKYWSRKGKGTFYNTKTAKKQTLLDASTFLDSKIATLSAASNALAGKAVSIVCTFDAQDLSKNWCEGINWISQVFRQIAQRKDIACEQCSKLLEDRFNLQKTEFFMSAREGSGYGENLLDNTNTWMLRYGRKMVERMLDLSERFPDDGRLKERALNLAARQVLFAISSDWPKMMHDAVLSEYAKTAFTQSILGFSTIFDSLGANFISTEWLMQAEKKYPFFPWINYRIFCKKK